MTSSYVHHIFIPNLKRWGTRRTSAKRTENPLYLPHVRGCFSRSHARASSEPLDDGPDTLSRDCLTLRRYDDVKTRYGCGVGPVNRTLSVGALWRFGGVVRL
jgi:hypothetical protein